MSKKSDAIFLQIVKSLKSLGWSTDSHWELSLRVDKYIQLTQTITAQGNLNNLEWSDEIPTLIRLKIVTEDEITFFTEFSVYAQISIGSIPTQEIDDKMMGNQAFTEKDVMNIRKVETAAKEIDNVVYGHIREVYQDYVDKNEDLVKFYHQGSLGGDEMKF